MDRPLSGQRIVILEDDYYQAYDSKFILEDAGATVVAVTATVPDLEELAKRGPIDAVMIDINLGRGLSFDFARALRRQGVPFMFLTGYDAGMLPEDLLGSPHVGKPANGDKIVAGLARLLARQS